MIELKLLSYYHNNINNNYNNQLTNDCALHKATLTNDLGLLKYLVENKRSLPDCFVGGLSPLHLASFMKKYEAADLLIKYGCNINLRSKKPQSFFRQSNDYTTELSKAYGYTPLHFVAENNCIEIATLLLNNGADPFALDKQGHSALEIAVEKGNLEIIEMLEKRTNEINEYFNSRNSENISKLNGSTTYENSPGSLTLTINKKFDKFMGMMKIRQNTTAVCNKKENTTASDTSKINSITENEGNEASNSPESYKKQARKRSDSESSKNSIYKRNWNKFIKFTAIFTKRQSSSSKDKLGKQDQKYKSFKKSVDTL